MKNWNIGRYARLLAGVIIASISLIHHDLWFAIFGVFFILHAALNLPCCCSGSCSNGRSSKKVYKDIIKPYKDK